jgi:hypothetical protein
MAQPRYAGGTSISIWTVSHSGLMRSLLRRIPFELQNFLFDAYVAFAPNINRFANSVAPSPSASSFQNE